MTRQLSGSPMTCEDVRERVELYLDQALSAAESKAVRTHLLGCDGCRSEIETAEAVEKRLRHVFRAETPPPQLWSRIAAALPADTTRTQHTELRWSDWCPSRRAAIAASALLTIGVLFAGRRLLMTEIDPDELMETPLDELRSFVDSGRPLDVATTDPVQLREWFVPRVDFPPPAPPTMSDVSLVGGRLCYFFRRRVAAYMYHGDGHIFSLYVMSDQDINPPFRSATPPGRQAAAVRQSKGFAHVLWREGKLYYSLVSDQPAAELVPVAQAIAMAKG